MNREDRVAEAFQTLRDGVMELIQDPNKLQETMLHYGNNYHYNTYSPTNTLLLMFETSIRKNKMFQMARGYRAWQKEFNRHVKKGEQAMWILAPKKVKVDVIDEETGEPVIDEKTGKPMTKSVFKGFIPVKVFELSQTEGDPIPRTTKNHEYKSINDLKLEDFISKVDVPVEFEELTEANGYTNGKKIVIGTHNDTLASICTLFHELAHFHLHYNRDGDEVKLYSDDSTNLKELEAESVAFMVSSALGIDNEYSMKYISNWNKENGDLDSEFESRSLKLLGEALAQIDCFMGCVSSQDN